VGRLTLQESIALEEGPARAAAEKAWMDYYELCLRPSLRADIIKLLTLKARYEEIGRWDVHRVFEGILDDADDLLREREIGEELKRTQGRDLDDQEPSTPGDEK